jgi:hypothetical protein
VETLNPGANADEKTFGKVRLPVAVPRRSVVAAGLTLSSTTDQARYFKAFLAGQRRVYQGAVALLTHRE